MAFDPKKDYWWMSLPEDFFDFEELAYLEDEVSNGSLYALLFVKLCLMSLKNKGMVGRVVADMFLPYSVAKLAAVSKMDVKDIKMALPVLKRLNLIVINEGIIYIPLVDSMVGEKKAGFRKIESEKRQIRRLSAVQAKLEAISGQLSGQLSDTTDNLKLKTDNLKLLDVTSNNTTTVVAAAEIAEKPVDNSALADKIRKLEANGIRTSVEFLAAKYAESEIDAYIRYAKNKSKKENYADLLFYALNKQIDIDPKYFVQQECPQCRGTKYEYYVVDGITEPVKGVCSHCKGKGYVNNQGGTNNAK